MAQNADQARQLAAYMRNTGAQIAHKPTFAGWDQMMAPAPAPAPRQGGGILSDMMGMFGGNRQAPPPTGGAPVPGTTLPPPRMSSKDIPPPPPSAMPRDPHNHVGMAMRFAPVVASPPPDVGYRPPAEVPNLGFGLGNARALQQAGMTAGHGNYAAPAIPSFEEWMAARQLGSGGGW